jgi:hypothetical protein
MRGYGIAAFMLALGVAIIGLCWSDTGTADGTPLNSTEGFAAGKAAPDPLVDAEKGNPLWAVPLGVLAARPATARSFQLPAVRRRRQSSTHRRRQRSQWQSLSDRIGRRWC